MKRKEKEIIYLHYGDKVRVANEMNIKLTDGNELYPTNLSQVYINQTHIRIVDFKGGDVITTIIPNTSIVYIETVAEKWEKPDIKGTKQKRIDGE